MSFKQVKIKSGLIINFFNTHSLAALSVKISPDVQVIFVIEAVEVINNYTW